MAFDSVSAQSAPFEVVSINDTPYGIPYKDWTAKWWQWLIGIPAGNNPLSDNTGTDCNRNQTGNVWFLAGASGTVQRSCTIPEGKAILFPVINSMCDSANFDAKTEVELTRCSQSDNDVVSNMNVRIDGVELQNIDQYRVASSVFNLTYPENNVLGYSSGETEAVSDGFWVFLKPLAKGDHTIEFRAVTNENPTTGTKFFLVDVDYNLNVLSGRNITNGR